MKQINHADIVVCHNCNMNCKYCVDSFRNNNDARSIDVKFVEKFLYCLSKNTVKLPRSATPDSILDVLLLGGEPTMIGQNKLLEIADLIHNYNFRAIMSTNGRNIETIKSVLPSFDSIQITVSSKSDIDFWRSISTEKINIKLAGTETLTKQKFEQFIDYTKDFNRKSMTLYFKPNFEQCCTDKELNNFINTLQFERIDSYEYTFYKGCRIKRCIPGVTNIADEPSIPKLYMNGNYNKSWTNENLDNYLFESDWTNYSIEGNQSIK